MGKDGKKYPLTPAEWEAKRARSAVNAEARRYRKLTPEQWAERRALRKAARVPKHDAHVQSYRRKESRAKRRAELSDDERVERKERQRILNRGKYFKYREKILARKKLYQVANREKRRVYKQNRDAKKSAGGVLSLDITETLLVRQRGLCPYCRVDLRTVKNHIDHIIPVAKNGANTDANVQLLCATCNLRKNAKHPVDFAQELGMLL